MKIAFPRRRRPGGAWPTYIIGLAALIVLAVGITSLGSSSSGSSAGRPTATVTKGVVQSTVSGTGSLEPTEQVELNFGSAGEVTAVEVEAGQKVHKGQALARIDASAAEASLAQARAELAEAEEALEGAEEAEGAKVAGREGAISMATAEAKLREARLAVKSARQEVDETTLRAPIDGTVASVSGEVGEIVSGEATAARHGAGASSSSPLAALAGASAESESAPTAFIVLSRLGRMQMEVMLSEADIDKVRVGQVATVSISALEGSELAGKVVQVGLLPETGEVVEYPAIIRLAQGAEGVRPGMSASAKIIVDQASNAIAVPTEAITALGPSKTVTVEEADGDEVQKTVTTGLQGDEETQVIDGLKPGETVILPEIGAVPGVLGSLLGEKAAGLTGAAGTTTGMPGGGGGRLRALLGG